MLFVPQLCFALRLDKMITCHCNIITEKEVIQAINTMLDEDCWQLIVPVKLYHAMEKRGKCCRCFPNVVDIIIRTTDEYHTRFNWPEEDRIPHRLKLLELRNHYAGEFNERRQSGNRAA